MNLFPGSDGMVKLPRLRRAAGFDGGASFACLAFDYTSGDQIAGQDCSDATQPVIGCVFNTALLGNRYAITGYVDGVVVNPFAGFPFYPVVYDGTLYFSDVAFQGWFGSNQSPIGTITMDGQPLCNVYLRFIGCIGNLCQFQLTFTSGGDVLIWSGLLTQNTPNGVYVNDLTGADALPVSLTVGLIAGVVTSATKYDCTT